MYTGDDFNYAELIAGDEQGYSDALLGIFDAIAPAASAALAALARGRLGDFHDMLAPTVPLSPPIFRAPTPFYKTGVVFMAYLNGHQDHFVMVGGAQAMRPLPYFAEVVPLASRRRFCAIPTLAATRMRGFWPCTASDLMRCASTDGSTSVPSTRRRRPSGAHRER